MSYEVLIDGWDVPASATAEAFADRTEACLRKWLEGAPSRMLRTSYSRGSWEVSAYDGPNRHARAIGYSPQDATERLALRLAGGQ